MLILNYIELDVRCLGKCMCIGLSKYWELIKVKYFGDLVLIG